MMQFEEKYKNDITKLEKILKRQIRQKQLFMNDIKNLRLKTKIHPTTQCKAMMPRSDKGNDNKISRGFQRSASLPRVFAKNVYVIKVYI